MTPEERLQFNELMTKVNDIHNWLISFRYSDRHVSDRKMILNSSLSLNGDVDIINSDGVTFGTSATQKLSFFGVTPVVQQTPPATLSEAGGDNDGTARAAINDIVQALAALGLYS